MFYVKNEENELMGPYGIRSEAESVSDRIDGLVVDLNFDNCSSGSNVDAVTIYCSVEGGVVEFGELPKGVRIALWDYDTEGFGPENLTEDSNGEEYFERVFESKIN